MVIDRLVIMLHVWVLAASGLGGQETSTPQPRSVPTDELTGIATGYSGHFACRQFAGAARELAIAVSDLEPASVAALLSSGADIDARAVEPYAHGMTILQTAVVHEWGIEAIRLLLDSGADVTLRDQRGDSVLTLACRNPLGADPTVLEELIRAGAPVNGPGVDGMTPLMCAALCDENGQTIEALLKASADVTARDRRGWTALMHATRRRREPRKIVEWLVRAGSPVNAKHAAGGTALSNAAFHGHTQSVQFLISAGADVNSRDNANWTPLICASINGHAGVARVLVDAGARLNDADQLGRTALGLARARGNTAVEQVLIAAGASK
jgi:ankyrin repeat protein